MHGHQPSACCLDRCGRAVSLHSAATTVQTAGGRLVALHAARPTMDAMPGTQPAGTFVDCADRLTDVCGSSSRTVPVEGCSTQTAAAGEVYGLPPPSCVGHPGQVYRMPSPVATTRECQDFSSA